MDIEELPADDIMNDPLEEEEDVVLNSGNNNNNDNNSDNDSGGGDNDVPVNRLLLADEQKMEDIEKPHHNDGKMEIEYVDIMLLSEPTISTLLHRTSYLTNCTTCPAQYSAAVASLPIAIPATNPFVPSFHSTR